MTGLAFVFPGSGSQYPGMASKMLDEYETARRLFGEASDIMGLDLGALCRTGSLARLSKIRVLLPALHVTNVAHYHIAIKNHVDAPSVVLGHSLGEYSALTCAGAISFTDSVRLVARRAEIAARAQETSDCATTIFKKTTRSTVERVLATCRETCAGDLSLACENSPSQFMITGEASIVLAAEQCLLKMDPGAEVVPIFGGAPYHGGLMTAHVPELVEALQAVSWRHPCVPVIANATARPVSDPEEIKAALAKQLDHTVLWHNSIRYLAENGEPAVIEIGPQSVLKNLFLEAAYPGEVLAHDDRRDVSIMVGQRGRHPAPAEGEGATILDAILDNFASCPDKVAVISAEGTLTYGELDEQSARLAGYLTNIGLGADKTVAIALPRSLSLIVALFATMRAGAAFLPLNLHHPVKRVATILQNSGTTCLITDSSHSGLYPFAGQEVLIDAQDWRGDIQQPPSHRPSPTDLAYVIYTSGSTGQPKGVCIEHKALENRLRWMQEAYPIGPGDKILQKTVCTFDVAVWELCWWAMHQAQIVLLPEGKEQDPRAITRHIRDHSVTVVHFVPSVLDLFLTYQDIISDQQALSSLHYVFTSGEKLSTATVRRFHHLTSNLPDISLINLYGPTEAAIDVTHHLCSRDALLDDIPIGQAISGIGLLVVNDELQPVDGIGELLITGIGLARGYLNAPELTGQSFVQVPALGGIRAYRTGDLVRKDTKTSAFHYIGRNDFQIKLRGQRIELEEIEQALNACEGVRTAAVFADGSSPVSTYIHAAVMADHGMDGETIHAALKQVLPDYMVPSRLLLLDNMPLSGNGKLDRKRLLELSRASTGTVADLRRELPAETSAPFPLSNAQKAMWLAQQRQPDKSLFETPTLIRLVGRIDSERLAEAVDAIVQRHDQLRVGISADEPMQYPNQHFPRLRFAGDWPADRPLTSLPGNDQGRYSQERPLAAFSLWTHGTNEHLLHVALDHIICDGWSKAVLIDDLLAFYRGKPTEAPRASYGEYIEKRRAFGRSSDHANALSHWKRALSGELPLLALPVDRPRPAQSAHLGSLEEFTLCPAIVRQVRAQARCFRTTPYNLLLAAYCLLLHRHSGQRDIIVGVPMAGRNEAPLERTVGLFVNVLPIRVQIDPNASFGAIVEQVKKVSLDALRYGSIGFEEIVQSVHPARHGSAFPIYQTTFQLDSLPVPSLDLGSAHAKLVTLDTGISQTDLSMSLYECGDSLCGTVEFDTELFDRDTAGRFAKRFDVLLKAIGADEGVSVARLPILCEEDLLAYECLNAASPQTTAGESLWPILYAALSRDPQRLILSSMEADVTAGEMMNAVESLAAMLYATGAKAGDRIAVVIPSGQIAVAAQLAVCRLGAVWIPIDPQTPDQRIADFIAMSSPRVVMTDANHPPLPALDSVADAATVRFVVPRWQEIAAGVNGHASCPQPNLRSDDDAVILFTSGTTGGPKGVRLAHRGLTALIASFIDSYDVKAKDALLPITSVGSASYVGEVLPILAGGGRLVLADRITSLDMRRLLDFIAAQRVTILSTVPGIVTRLNATAEDRLNLSSLRLVLCGGEELTYQQVSHLTREVEIVNGYGLTEAAICSTYYRVNREDYQHKGVVPIGRAIAGTTLCVLDENGALVPSSVVGELHIGGVGVTSGFLDPADDAGRLVRNTTDGSILLRTGDRVRLLPSGDLQYLGRIDRQIQIRGYRVEPGEIENTILQHPEIASVYVTRRLPFSSGGRHRMEPLLCAFYTTAANVPIAEVELRAWVSARLPSHMVPALFMQLESTPVGLNGKIDESALPAIDDALAFFVTSRRAQAPQGPVETALAEIWQGLLGGMTPGADMNFFDVGGHSLLVMDLQRAIAQRFGHHLTLVDLFDATTIGAQARLIERLLSGTSMSNAETPGQIHTSARRAAYATARWRRPSR